MKELLNNYNKDNNKFIFNEVSMKKNNDCHSKS
jgi:hypothetical protein